MAGEIFTKRGKSDGYVVFLDEADSGGVSPEEAAGKKVDEKGIANEEIIPATETVDGKSDGNIGSPAEGAGKRRMTKRQLLSDQRVNE